MNDKQAIMKFEFLPNEILVECFEYLNAIDIFYSFDFLNSRFYKLIRNISLHLNIVYIQESPFVQFCNKILSYSQLKNQIISLKLSKHNTFDTIQTLFSFLSLNELSQLRSLTLIDLDVDTIHQISSTLPLFNNLRYFCLIGWCRQTDKILASLSTSTVQSLSIPTLDEDLASTLQFTSIVSLMISQCWMQKLCHFFKHTPNLQYLRIDTIYSNNFVTIDELCSINMHAAHLKLLVINSFEAGFDSLEILLQQTPNLKVLMISAADDRKIIDALRWQHLITASLPVLNVFKFKFSVEGPNDDNDIFDEFQQFQSDFWRQQHHWYTEWVTDKNYRQIYTVPCISNACVVTPDTKRYYNELTNNSSTFASVTDLTLFLGAITDTCKYYFSNVETLILKNDRVDINHGPPLFKTKHIGCLKTMVNLCTLTHLDISWNCQLKSSSIMLQLLKEAPYLSSLTISKDTLFSLFNNLEVCECLNRMIKKLEVDICDDNSIDFDEMVKLCQIFSNIEQFGCSVSKLEILLLVLNELSKLPHMKAFFYKTPFSSNGNHWFTDHVSEFNAYPFRIECITQHDTVYDFDDDSDDDDLY